MQVTDARGSQAGDTGYTTWYFYDALNRQVCTIDPLGQDWALNAIPDTAPSSPSHSVLTVYDSVGNVTAVTDQLGRTTDYAHDNLGRKTSVTEPDPDDAGPLTRPQTSYAYDADGNVLWTADPLGNVTRYEYDKLGRQVGRTEFDPADLIGFWRLNDQTGTTAADCSGNGRTGTLVNGPAWTGDGEFNGALAFNGTNSYVSMPDTGDASLEYRGGNLTVSAWIYINATETSGGCLISKPWNGEGQYAFRLWLDSANRLAFSLCDIAAGTITADNSLSAGAWHHVAATVDSSKLMTLYVDGVSVKSRYHTITDWTFFGDDLNVPLVIGAVYPHGAWAWSIPGQTLDGKMDDVRIYGRSLSAAEIAGNMAWQTTAYNAAGTVASITDSEQNTTSYTYDRLNRLVTETDPLGHGTTYVYDAAGNVVKKTDRDGRVTEYSYDAVNRRVEERWRPDDASAVFHTIHTYYDANGQVRGVVETDTANAAAGTRYQYTYDADGQLTTARVAPGDLAQTPTYTWTSSNAQLQSSDPTSDWDFDGTAERYHDAFSYSFNVGDKVLVTLDSTDFDAALLIRRPNGSTAWIDDNGGGGTNACLQFTIDTSGTWHFWATSADVTSGAYHLTVVKDANPIVPDALVQFNYTYDKAGNLLTATENAPLMTGAVLSTITTNTYDALNRLGWTKQAVGISASTRVVNKRADFTYNDDGSANTVTRYSDDGTTTVVTSSYTYDGMGRLTGLTHTPAVSSAINYTWTYDAASRVAGMTTPDGTTNSIGYDATDQLTGVDYSYQDDEGYTYDANGNRTGATAGLSSSVYVTGTGNQLLSDGAYRYAYDNEGSRTLKYVDADASGTLNAGDTDVTAYAWDYRNRLTKVSHYTTFANYQASTTDQTVEYSYDYLDRRIQRKLDSNGSATGGVDYFYNVYQGDNPAVEIHDIDGLAGEAYTPHLQHRYLCGQAVDQILASEQTTATAASTVLWGLPDHEGTIRDVIASVGIGSVNYGINAQTSATGTGFIMYSAQNIISRWGPAVQFSVNNSAHLIAVKYDAGQWYFDNGVHYYAFVPCETDVLVAAVDFTADTITGLQGSDEFEHGIGKGYASSDLTFIANQWNGAFSQGDFTINGTYFVLAGHRKYDSFGNMTSESASAADFIFGYTGQALDKATGLYDYWHRWYDPAAGRFASEDPSGFAAGDQNLYRYVGNNPLNNTDPTGLCSSRKSSGFLGALGSAIGGAVSSYVQSYVGAATSIAGATASYLQPYMSSGVANLAGNVWGDVRSSIVQPIVAAADWGLGITNRISSAFTSYSSQAYLSEAPRWATTTSATNAFDMPLGQMLWNQVAAPLLQGSADVANGITNLVGHTDNLAIWGLNAGIEAVNDLAQMSNYGQPIFSSSIPYFDVRDWSKDLVMHESDWVHNVNTIGTEVFAGAGVGKLVSSAGEITFTRPARAAGESVVFTEVSNPSAPGTGSTLRPGSFARTSIAAPKPGQTVTSAMRRQINEIGRECGCHTCGSRNPGTTSGNFIPDHQPPTAMTLPGQSQRLYPHCQECSQTQGGQVRAWQQ